MVPHRTAFHIALSLLSGVVALGSSIGPLAAQPLIDRTGLLPFHAEARAGMVAYSSGDDAGCDQGLGPSLGLEVRSRGPIILAVTGDMHFDWSMECGGALPIRDFEGQLVEVRGRNDFMLDPRLAFHAGGAFTVPFLGRSSIEPTLGVGVQYTEMEFGELGRGDVEDWLPWYGATLTVRPPQLGMGVQLEVGRHQLKRRYCPITPGRCAAAGIVREFEIWEPFLRVGLTLPLN